MKNKENIITAQLDKKKLKKIKELDDSMFKSLQEQKDDLKKFFVTEFNILFVNLHRENNKKLEEDMHERRLLFERQIEIKIREMEKQYEGITMRLLEFIFEANKQENLWKRIIILEEKIKLLERKNE